MPIPKLLPLVWSALLVSVPAHASVAALASSRCPLGVLALACCLCLIAGVIVGASLIRSSPQSTVFSDPDRTDEAMDRLMRPRTGGRP